MKVRAGMMGPGRVIRLDGFEFVVDEDELGEWIVERRVYCSPESVS
jgi:hypothetical protein